MPLSLFALNHVSCVSPGLTDTNLSSQQRDFVELLVGLVAVLSCPSKSVGCSDVVDTMVAFNDTVRFEELLGCRIILFYSTMDKEKEKNMHSLHTVMAA